MRTMFITTMIVATEVIDPIAGSATERLGTVGLLVVASFFVAKWLASQLDAQHKYYVEELQKKDARILDVTDRFLAATREQTGVIIQVTDEMRRMREAHEKVTNAIGDLTVALKSQKP